MPDVDAIIEQILAASRSKGGRAFASTRTYADEPILLRGSQLASYLPEPIRQMRALARCGEARTWSDARLFVEQAHLMADYVDDFPFDGEFSSYFPTYESMTNPQLRGYFTWRARVRRGRVERTSPSFAFVYLYELVNGVGAAPGMEAFRSIESFWQEYRSLDPVLDRYVRPWLVDYVAFHDLPVELAAPYLNTAHDRAVGVLRRAEQRALDASPPKGRRRPPHAFGTDPAGDEELLGALDALSTHHIREGRLNRDEPDAVRSVCCAVFADLARHYASHRAQGLTESLFGTRHAMPHLMFASAVFYPGGRHRDCVVELDETCRYVCQNGIWSCDSLHDGGARRARLGQVLRAVDRQLRIALGHPSPLKERADPKYLVKIIDRAIGDYLAWRVAHAPRRIEIDLAKLADIRASAAETREALLVDEEREEETPAPEPAAPPQGKTDDTLALTADELAFLRGLLDGRTPDVTGADLLVDTVNGKLYDLLGDTAVEFDAQGVPRLVEDYAEDVRAALDG